MFSNRSSYLRKYGIYVVDATPEVATPAGQHVIGANRVLYKDDKIVGPVVHPVMESASKPTSPASSD